MIQSIMTALLVLACAGVATADEWRRPRSDPQWHSPPPAWGNAPGPLPRGVEHRAPASFGRNDGYPTIRRDRQRWREDPNDRHESRRRDGWHAQGRNDWRGGRHGWDDDDREPRGGVVRRRDRNDFGHDDRRDGYWPPPAYGPYAPVPGYDERRGLDDDRWRHYDD